MKQVGTNIFQLIYYDHNIIKFDTSQKKDVSAGAQILDLVKPRPFLDDRYFLDCIQDERITWPSKAYKVRILTCNMLFCFSRSDTQLFQNVIATRSPRAIAINHEYVLYTVHARAAVTVYVYICCPKTLSVRCTVYVQMTTTTCIKYHVPEA
jgi:hypothetical protein